MSTSSHVFISFKTQEREFASLLRRALVQSNYKVWWQEEIQCGQEWHGEIDKAIQEAGAVVVLWSKKSMLSPWVRHEASQAIVKGVYTPIRIDIMEIDIPYNRVQATDMMNWAGDLSHPGYQNLLARLHGLMPPPISLWRQTIAFFWKQRAVILLSMIAMVALLLLLRQSYVLDKQIINQERAFTNIQHQSSLLSSQGLILQSQINKQDELIEYGRKQSNTLDKQLKQQNAITSNVQNQSKILHSQILKQEEVLKNVQRTLQPIQNLSVSAFIDLNPSTPGVAKYIITLRKNLLDSTTNKVKSNLPNGVYISQMSGGSPVSLTLSEKSALWPNKQDTSWLFYVVKYVELSLDFKKNNRQGNADLSMTVGSYDPDGSERGDIGYNSSIHWNIKNNKLSIYFRDTPNPSYWRSNGSIVSIPDIESSIITVGFKSTMVPSLSDNRSSDAVLKSRSNLGIASIFIDCSGRKLHFRGSEMKKGLNTLNLPTYTSLVAKSLITHN